MRAYVNACGCCFICLHPDAKVGPWDDSEEREGVEMVQFFIQSIWGLDKDIVHANYFFHH